MPASALAPALEVLRAVADVLALRTGALAPPEGPGLGIALGVAMLAAASTMVGHGVVFVLNGVRGARLAVSWAIGTLFLVFLQAVAGAMAVLGAAIVLPASTDLRLVLLAYLLALSPRVWGFIVFLPYFGLLLGRVQEGWVLVCQVILLHGLLGTGWAAALAVAGISWGLTQVLSRVLARPIASVSSRLWTLATGRPTFLSAHDILAGAPFVPLEPREVLRS